MRMLPLQVAEGGVVQVTVAQGSPRQTPLAQPLGHVSVREV